MKSIWKYTLIGILLIVSVIYVPKIAVGLANLIGQIQEGTDTWGK